MAPKYEEEKEMKMDERSTTDRHQLANILERMAASGELYIDRDGIKIEIGTVEHSDNNDIVLYIAP
jgi:hypothetical protein